MCLHLLGYEVNYHFNRTITRKFESGVIFLSFIHSHESNLRLRASWEWMCLMGVDWQRFGGDDVCGSLKNNKTIQRCPGSNINILSTFPGMFLT